MPSAGLQVAVTLVTNHMPPKRWLAPLRTNTLCASSLLQFYWGPFSYCICWLISIDLSIKWVGYNPLNDSGHPSHIVFHVVFHVKWFPLINLRRGGQYLYSISQSILYWASGTQICPQKYSCHWFSVHEIPAFLRNTISSHQLISPAPSSPHPTQRSSWKVTDPYRYLALVFFTQYQTRGSVAIVELVEINSK